MVIFRVSSRFCPVSCSQNAGKGAALAAGVREARGEILLLLDADLGSSAAQAELLMRPVVEDEA